MSENAISYNSLSDDILADFVKNGDDNAFNELYVRYLGTIGFISRKFSAEGYEQNDFVQEGLLGLLQACRSYDKSGAASFKNYMSIVIERRFITIIRNSNTMRKIPRSQLVQIDELSENVEDNALTPEEQIAFKEHLKSIIDKLKLLLSKSEFDALMLYGNGLSYKQISHTLSIPEKSVDNALQRARKKISAHKMS